MSLKKNDFLIFGSINRVSGTILERCRAQGPGPVDRAQGPGPVDRAQGLGPVDRAQGPGPGARAQGPPRAPWAHLGSIWSILNKFQKSKFWPVPGPSQKGPKHHVAPWTKRAPEEPEGAYSCQPLLLGPGTFLAGAFYVTKKKRLFNFWVHKQGLRDHFGAV